MDRASIDQQLKLTTDHALLYGPRGVAKTTSAVNAFKGEQEIFQVTLTAESNAASYLGHYVPKGGEFLWHAGPFQRAWEAGGLLVINEIDHASEDVCNLLHVILDRGVGAYFTLPTGETIRPADDFRCIATMNGVPGDLPTPLLDRFSLRLPVMHPSQAQLDTLPPEVALTCKTLYERGQHEKTTYRMLASFVRLRDQYTAELTPAAAEKLAASAIYGNDADGEALLKVIKLNAATLKGGAAEGTE